MNIIIPTAGLGRRFAEENYSVPKPLIKVLGEPMIFYVLRSLKVGPFDKIFIVHTHDLTKYMFEEIVRKEFPNLNLNFIVIDFYTRGSVETVMFGLKYADLREKTLILDCDTFCDEDVIGMAKEGDDNLIFYFKDESKYAIFSYVKIEKEDKISQIKEKERISDNACMGAYSFISGQLLKSYCERFLSDTSREGEFYISALYEEMILNGHPIRAREIKSVHCLGTPEQLKEYCLTVRQLKKMRFCFDLDGTLVTFPTEKGNYGTVKPIIKNIKLVRNLHSQGHVIIIYTSRKMLSSNHNVGLATQLAYEEVFKTLKRFEIPFDEIYFGKPYAHFYIDDLSSKQFDIEKEIGFYFTDIEPRHFNQIEYGDDYVVKKTNSFGEIFWYSNIPEAIKGYFPVVFSINGKMIKMEKINGVVFSYLLTEGSLKPSDIKDLLGVINKIHHSLEVPPDLKINVNENYVPKVIERYNSFDYRKISSEAEFYFEKITQKLLSHVPIIGVILGDPVFSNIFLCGNRLIKFVDMRGRVGDVETIFGDIFYDYAKIYQSLYGYDFVLNDCNIDFAYLKKLRDIFEFYFIEKFSTDQLKTLKVITSSLFFSLIPLHTDSEKQKIYFELAKEIIDV